MKENLTELVFILDRSGSMSGLEADTIGGFNSLIKKQKEADGDALVTTILFDTSFNIIHDRVSLKKIKKLTEKDYYVGGCTALLDAVGGGINYIKEKQKQVTKENRPAKTLFVITTDGLENSSTEFSVKQVKDMISKAQKKDKWEFLFLGANMDAVEVANDMGIRAQSAVNYVCDANGTALNYEALNEVISDFRMAEPDGCSELLATGDWKKNIEANYKKRNMDSNRSFFI